MRPALACFFGTMLMLSFSMIDPEMWDAWAYLLILTILTIAGMVVLKPSGLDPLAYLLLTPTVLFGLESMTLRLGWFNIIRYNENSWHSDLTDEALKKAAMLVLAGNAMLWLGFAQPVARRLGERLANQLAKLTADDQFEPMMLRIWGAFGIGISARLYMIVSGITGYFSDLTLVSEASGYIQFLNLIDGFATLSMLLYACILLKQERPRWTPFLAMLGVELGTILLLGFKGMLIYRFIYLGIIYAVIRRRGPYRLMLTGALVLLVLFPINLAARRAYNEGRVQRGDIGSIGRGLIDGMAESFESVSVLDSFADSGKEIVLVSGNFEQFAMVMQYVDTTGTRWYGIDYLYPIFSVIPRAVWPSKPSPSHGGWVYKEIYRMPGDSAESQTVPGDMYLNFGWMGVVFGLFVFGMLGRIAGAVAIRLTSIRLIPLAPFLIHGFGMPISDLGAHLTNLIRTIVIYSLVLVFLTPRVHRLGAGDRQP
ncbi:hypothetical protein SAMN05444166_5083 [Singulisphaera sp. GP187]|uniref:O-antigen polymerase n=1 Tax=Singulisphaera sp. GP187 TaxID=1882752 RepID=UPI000927DBFC|nr:O-antigen polymerase [Singulisphaera sp. GP187]SIO55351.1 hypothetical protein SAMN05444166_5083 [Singulisphaera sp. GP187]